jgi:hypothetical protein
MLTLMAGLQLHEKRTENTYNDTTNPKKHRNGFQNGSERTFFSARIPFIFPNVESRI